MQDMKKKDVDIFYIYGNVPTNNLENEFVSITDEINQFGVKPTALLKEDLKHYDDETLVEHLAFNPKKFLKLPDNTDEWLHLPTRTFFIAR